MTLLGYVLLLTAAIYCAAAPDNSCGRPERMVEAELVGDWESDRYPGGTQAVYQCRPGYTRQGTIKMACIGGEWQYFGKKGECKKRPCGHPGDLKFGTFELTKEETFVFGAVVTYSCEEGYRMASKERVRQCTATGWSNYLPECDVMNCPPIAATDNLNVLSTSYDDEYTVGQVVKFECKAPNLKLNGASEIFCTSEGNWNLDPPTCTVRRSFVERWEDEIAERLPRPIMGGDYKVLIANLMNSLAASTLPTYLNAWESWKEFCTARGTSCWQSDDELVLSFICSLLMKNLGLSSVLKLSARVSFFFRLLDLIPMSDYFIVKQLLKGYGRVSLVQ